MMGGARGGWIVSPVISFLVSFVGMFLLDFDNFATAAWGRKNQYVERIGCRERNSNEALLQLIVDCVLIIYVVSFWMGSVQISYMCVCLDCLVVSFCIYGITIYIFSEH